MSDQQQTTPPTDPTTMILAGIMRAEINERRLENQGRYLKAKADRQQAAGNFDEAAALHLEAMKTGDQLTALRVTLAELREDLTGETRWQVTGDQSPITIADTGAFMPAGSHWNAKPEPGSQSAQAKNPVTHRGVGEGDAGLPLPGRKEIAAYMKKWGLFHTAGFAITNDTAVFGWSSSPDARNYIPGIIAFDLVTGRRKITTGGDCQHGADRWEPMEDPEEAPETITTGDEWIDCGITAEDPAGAVANLRRLANMIEESPDAAGWKVGFDDGSGAGVRHREAPDFPAGS